MYKIVHLRTMFPSDMHYTAIAEWSKCGLNLIKSLNMPLDIFIECHIGSNIGSFTCILSYLSSSMYSLLSSLQDGATALFMASQDGHTSVVKLLLEAKAKPDVTNKVMFTAVAFDGVLVVLEQ